MAENVGVSRRGFIAGVSALALGLSATGCSTSTGSKAKEGNEAKEEKWVPTTCNGCFNRCGILAHVVDGVAMELKGNPASPVGGGHICARGAAGLMQLYDPNRLTKPLKRTNPEKGFDKDPGWEEITWDEAYSLLEENLQAALEKNPQGVAKNGMVANLAGTMISSFALGAVYGSVDAGAQGAPLRRGKPHEMLANGLAAGKAAGPVFVTQSSSGGMARPRT